MIVKFVAAAVLVGSSVSATAQAEQIATRHHNFSGSFHGTRVYEGRSALETRLGNDSLRHDPIFGWRRGAGGGGGR